MLNARGISTDRRAARRRAHSERSGLGLMTVAILLVPTIGGTVGYVLYSRFDVGLSSTSQRASVDSNSGPLGPNVPAPADEADEASDDDDGPAVTAPAPTPSTTPPTTAPPPDGDVATRYSLVYDEPPTDGGPFELTLTVGNTGSEPITISPADLALEVDGQPLAPSQPTPGPITVAPDAFAAVPVSFAVPAGAERFELVISTGDERTSDRITVAL